LRLDTATGACARRRGGTWNEGTATGARPAAARKVRRETSSMGRRAYGAPRAARNEHPRAEGAGYRARQRMIGARGDGTRGGPRGASGRRRERARRTGAPAIRGDLHANWQREHIPYPAAAPHPGTAAGPCRTRPWSRLAIVSVGSRRVRTAPRSGERVVRRLHHVVLLLPGRAEASFLHRRDRGSATRPCTPPGLRDASLTHHATEARVRSPVVLRTEALRALARVRCLPADPVREARDHLHLAEVELVGVVGDLVVVLVLAVAEEHDGHALAREVVVV